MKFVADESVDRQIVDRLRQEGFEVFFVAEMAPSTKDPEVLALARHEHAPLITADKDFGELVFRQRLVESGVILLRLEGLRPDTKAEIVALQTLRHAVEFTGCFAVISPGRVRMRKRFSR